MVRPVTSQLVPIDLLIYFHFIQAVFLKQIEKKKIIWAVFKTNLKYIFFRAVLETHLKLNFQWLFSETCLK